MEILGGLLTPIATNTAIMFFATLVLLVLGRYDWVAHGFAIDFSDSQRSLLSVLKIGCLIIYPFFFVFNFITALGLIASTTVALAVVALIMAAFLMACVVSAKLRAYAAGILFCFLKTMSTRTKLVAVGFLSILLMFFWSSAFSRYPVTLSVGPVSANTKFRMLFFVVASVLGFGLIETISHLLVGKWPSYTEQYKRCRRQKRLPRGL